MTAWDKAKSIILKSKTLLVATHVFPDGDAAGTELALAEALRRLGKKVLVLNPHPIPKRYHFLERRGAAMVWSEALRRRVARCDAAIIVDVSSTDRLDPITEVIRSAGIPSVSIDHHETNPLFADVNIVDGTRSSAGEMVFDLIRSLGVPVTRSMAQALFVSIATDTGWFRFSNTSGRTMRVAAELIDLGAAPDQLYEAIHETLTWSSMALMERVLATLRSECGGRLAYLHATEQMMRETGATQEDIENFVDLPRAIAGVRLVLFIREVDGKVKVSMRSKGVPSVVPLAVKHGGGGHARAAGIVFTCPIQKVIRIMVRDARRLLETGRC